MSTSTQQSEIDSFKKQTEDIENTKLLVPQTVIENQSNKLQISATFIAERPIILYCL